MPQFDTFSFFSQLFWVLLSFTMLYLSLSYYLLPAIAITLKVRKRKLLSQAVTPGGTNEITGNSYLHELNIHLEKIVFDIISPLQAAKDDGSSAVQANKVSVYLLENEILRTFSVDLFKKVSNTTLLQK